MKFKTITNRLLLRVPKIKLITIYSYFIISLSFASSKPKIKTTKTEVQPKFKVDIEDQKDVAFEMGDSIYIKMNKGIGLSYNLRNENKKIFAFLGNHEGMELGEIGFRDYNGPSVNVFGVCEGGIQGSARKTGDTEVGFWISDPEGMVLQGKNNLAKNFALRITNGSTQIGNGTNLLTVRNNGQTTISGNLGIMNDSPASTVDINGSLALKVQVVSISTQLDNSTTYVYTGSSDETFTLPEIELCINRMYYIKNRGKGVIKLLCKGANLIYSTQPTPFIYISPGGSMIIQNDGTYWITF